MKVEILGTGCAKCHKLEQNATEAVKNLGLAAEIVKVTDLDAILSYGVMMTPALALDGKVMVVGKVPSVAEITTMLAGAAEERADTC